MSATLCKGMKGGAHTAQQVHPSQLAGDEGTTHYALPLQYSGISAGVCTPHLNIGTWDYKHMC